MSRHAKKLDGNWYEVEDPSSGRIYYANSETKETSWTFPEELKTSMQNESVTPASNDKKTTETAQNNKEEGWEETTDPKTGRIYYYNRALKQTSWKKPQPMVRNDSAEDNWIERFDDITKKSYFYNTKSGVTQWVKPGTLSKKSSDSLSVTAVSGPVATHDAIELALSPQAKTERTFREPPIPPSSTTKRIRQPQIRMGSNDLLADDNKLSLAGAARLQKSSDSGIVENPDGIAPITVDDRFARLRALKNRGGASETAVEPPTEALETPKVTTQSMIKKIISETSSEFHFEEYTQEYFASMKGKTGFDGSVLCWSSDKLKDPLHYLNNPALVRDAKSVNQCILSYMGDATSKDSAYALASKIMGVGIASPEELRDEIYCQLVKQTTQNPSSESLRKGWELVASVCSLFPPSDKLAQYLSSYLKRSAESLSHPAIQALAGYSLLKLSKTILAGTRSETASELEFESIRRQLPVHIRVHLLNGDTIPMRVESWTTVADLNQFVAEYLQIEDATPFGVVEIDSADELRNFSDEYHVLDILSTWAQEYQQIKKAKATPSFKLVYMVKYYVETNLTNPSTLQLFFNQSVYDVTDSHYPMSECDAFRLGALQAQVYWGDSDTSAMQPDDIEMLLPKEFYDEDAKVRLFAMLKESQQLVKGYSKNEAMTAYVKYIQPWQLYGSRYFTAHTLKNANLPCDLIIAINGRGILFVDPNTKKVVEQHPFQQIVTWGQTKSTFVFVVGDLQHQNRLYFTTDHGIAMNVLLREYIKALVAQ